MTLIMSDDRKIVLTDPLDIVFTTKAKGAKVSGARLPSGFRVPAPPEKYMDWIVDSPGVLRLVSHPNSIEKMRERFLEMVENFDVLRTHVGRLITLISNPDSLGLGKEEALERAVDIINHPEKYPMDEDEAPLGLYNFTGCAFVGGYQDVDIRKPQSDSDY